MPYATKEARNAHERARRLIDAEFAEKCRARNRKWSGSKKGKAFFTKRWQEQRETLIKRMRERAKNNRASENKRITEWRRNRTPEQRAKSNKYVAERKQRDACFHLIIKMRGRINTALRQQRAGKRTKSTVEYLGCTISELMRHLESQFAPGMSWENRNLWHIDHKAPCDSFDLSIESERKKCFHYTNLQPLWADDNLRKGSRI